MKKCISQGAEAKIFLNEDIRKDRFQKTYRIPEIDNRLRKFRTKREAKILEKLALIDFPAPRLIETDKEHLIDMTFVSGKKVRDILEKSSYRALSQEIGKKIAILHNYGIIHGDLTTSNMIMKEEIYVIDFGLSFFSHKIEDMAVDLHLMKQALESKHYTIWEDCFKALLKSYQKEAQNGKDVIRRLEQVEKRGRYKTRGINKTR